MFFLFTDIKATCIDCGEWQRHTTDNDGCDIGFCPVFNNLTLESYDCDVVHQLLREIGLNHTTKCSECEFKSSDIEGDICKVKVRLKQDGRRIVDEENCPIRITYKYIDNIKEEI